MLAKLLRNAFARIARRDVAAAMPGVPRDPPGMSQLLHDGARQAGEGNREAAEQTYRRVLQLAPDNADALYSLGVIYGRRNEYAAARQCLEQVLAKHPNHIESINALGNMARFQHNLAEAVRYYMRALDLEPGFVPALSNLGLCLNGEGKSQEGIAYLERAFRLRPDDAGIVLNYAVGLLDLGREAEGEERLLQALQLDPNLSDAHTRLATLQLGKGRFREGWREYEWRMRSEQWEAQLRVDCPVWTGSPLDGCAILVRGEQGLGDQIMFASCLPEVIAQAKLCVVEIDGRLKKLFSRSFPSAWIYVRRHKGVPGWIADDLRFDCQVQIGSLPYRLGRDLDNFPRHRGYLAPDPVRVLAWRSRLGGLGDAPKVGISWRGGTKETRQATRSVLLSQWMPILKERAHWISLQYGEAATEVRDFGRAHGLALHHWQEAIDDYDETAALVAALDLVISVQTAVVHLAGALGRPAWVMVPVTPEWRYLASGDRLPWYPSIRVWRQDRPGEWPPLIECIAGELRDFAAPARGSIGTLSG